MNVSDVRNLISDDRIAPALRNRARHDDVGSIERAYRDLTVAENNYDEDEQDYAIKSELLRNIANSRTRVEGLEQEAKVIERQIGYMTPPDGKLWCELEMLLAEDRRIARLQLQSRDEDDVRLARIRLEGDDLKETAFNTELAEYKARLRSLRG
jgi:hypothetical protein